MRKQREKNTFRAFRLSAVLLAVVMMLGIASPSFALPVASGEGEDFPIMVSLGDSYSSGEGVDPFYCSGNADKFAQPDFLAHRSRLSWPGKLQLTDAQGNRLTMSQHKATYSNKTKSYDSFKKNNWYFVASSGADTYSLRGTQNKSFDHDTSSASPNGRGTVTLDSQLKVFESIEPGTTDYVTMTMGGNDAHFADVFIYAALNCSFINLNGMSTYLDKIWEEFYEGSNSIYNRLIKAYTDIRNAAGKQADIIIAGYPKILPKNGFLLFSASEAAEINSAITQLNSQMRELVESMNAPDFKLHFVSVEEAFEGHEIYTGVLNEYINGIKLIRPDDLSYSQIISSYSIHPNLKGVQAYAECVQACIDQIELEKQQANLATYDTAADTAEPDPIAEEEVPTEAELPPAVIRCEDSALGAQSGESIVIPVCLEGETALNRCTLELEYDSEQLQILSASPAADAALTVSDTIGVKENCFTFTLSSEEPLSEGTLFYLNATVLTPEEIVLHLKDVAPETEAAPGVQCEDILLNSSSLLCTLTANLTDLPCLEGAQVLVAEGSACTLRGTPACTGQSLSVSLTAADRQAELYLYKPGYTGLHLVVEGIVAGQTIDLTAALLEAAAGQPLFSAGDVNRDGCVSSLDVNCIVAPELYGATVAQADSVSDLNADGVISLADVAIILCSDNFGAEELTIHCENTL